MRFVAKLLIGALAAGLLMRRGGGVQILTYYRQGDPAWAHTFLGFSTTETIWGGGCMLASLGMAAGAILGADHDFDPGTMNNLVKIAGGFSGALLRLADAADAVDLVAPESERIHSSRGASKDELRSAIQRTLDNGGVALVNVDKTFTGTGEHWIAVHATAGGAFLGADPALGRDTPINIASLDNPAVDWGGGKFIAYDVVGVAPVYRKAA